MRRLLWITVSMAFALSLHASVPTMNASRGLNRAAELTPDIPLAKLASTHHTLALTASPADASFYEEFYPANLASEAVQPAPAKSGALHWFASLFKKTIKRVSFI